MNLICFVHEYWSHLFLIVANFLAMFYSFMMYWYDAFETWNFCTCVDWYFAQFSHREIPESLAVSSLNVFYFCLVVYLVYFVDSHFRICKKTFSMYVCVCKTVLVCLIVRISQNWTVCSVVDKEWLELLYMTSSSIFDWNIPVPCLNVVL